MKDVSLASLEDVEALLESPPENPNLLKILILEASDLIASEFRGPLPDPAPGWIQRMCARVVVRAATREDGGIPVGLENVSSTAGPFSQSYGFSKGANDGGVWLTAAERRRLRRCHMGAFSYRTW